MRSPVRIAAISKTIMAASWSCSAPKPASGSVIQLKHRLSLDWRQHQCDRRPTSHLHYDGALQYVDERLRMIGLHRVHASRRVLDGDHREFSSRISREIP